MEHFNNDGYGWTCQHCSTENEAREARQGSRARFFSEGEAEERELKLATPTLARWRNAEHTALYCPRCGVEELLHQDHRV